MTRVAIIGGGPGGSTLGSYLSLAGIENAIYEAVRHPRPHVGESLVTASNRVFREIGFHQTLEDGGFVRKYGAGWHHWTGDDVFTIQFSEIDQPGVEQSYAYHVDRARFDHLLLRHAASLGSRVEEEVRVTRVLFEDGRACGVRLRTAAGEREERCDVVVDASGRQTVIGRQLGLKQPDPHFDQFAVYGWFEGVDRGPTEHSDFIHIYFLPAKRGWAWQIPITATTTSVGVVAEREVFRESKRRLPGYFAERIASSEALAAAMQGARRVGELQIEAEYSYSMQRVAGPGYLLVGDAARFVDPIFSSGVSVAAASARFASEAIVAASEGADEAESFERYQARIRAGVEIWYDFIRLYYKLRPLFTRFIAPRRFRSQMIELIQGEVFDRAEVPVLEEIRKAVRSIESAESHPWKELLDPISLE